MKNIKDLSPDIINLYRYFAYAAHMRDLFRKENIQEWHQLISNSENGLLIYFLSTPGLYLQYSYSGIYLVIEGWKALKLKDAKIESLLESPYVDRLRRFRNATFHFQKEPLSDKHLQFFGTEEERTEEWLGTLYKEFERFFVENSLQMTEQMKAEIRGKDSFEIAKAIQKYKLDIDPQTGEGG